MESMGDMMAGGADCTVAALLGTALHPIRFTERGGSDPL